MLARRNNSLICLRRRFIPLFILRLSSHCSPLIAVPAADEGTFAEWKKEFRRDGKCHPDELLFERSVRFRRKASLSLYKVRYGAWFLSRRAFVPPLHGIGAIKSSATGELRIFAEECSLFSSVRFFNLRVIFHAWNYNRIIKPDQFLVLQLRIALEE